MKAVMKVASLCVAACVLVGSAVAQKVGSTAMQFLKVMPSARGTALGDAYSVLASGAEAVFWNPSGLALTTNQEVSTCYVMWLLDTQQGALSYAVALGEFGALGAQVQYVDYGEFEEAIWAPPYNDRTDYPGLTGNTFHPASYLFGLSYAKSLTDKFSVGATAKYAHESLYDGRSVSARVREGVFENVKTWANGLLFDFGVRYRTGYRSVQIGAAVQNFGADVKYARESNAVPLLFRFGIAADIMGRDALLAYEEESRLGVAFDLFQPNDYTQQAHIGIEYEFLGAFALRGGYKFNYDVEGLTLGAGLKHTMGAVSLLLDYSYGSMGRDLGYAQRISLGVQL